MNRPAKQPGVLDLLARKDREAAKRLASLKGGTRVYIPNQDALTDEHWLVKDLGPIAAAYLVREYGGTYIKVPLGTEAGILNQTRAIVRQGRAYGWSVRETAQAAGVTMRTVERICSKDRNDRQMKLFEGEDA